MYPSSVRSKLSTGEPVITAKASYHHPDIVEIMGAFGFDAVWLCLEHKRVDPALVGALILACRVHRMDAIVRVKPSNYTDILWLLEAGARGLMLPRVRTVDEVREVAAAMKFHPLGRRGFDGIHAEANFGLTPALTYMAHANAQNYLIVQIEEPEVVPFIDDIAALPGVDMLFVGPSDLTLGFGQFGNLDAADVQTVIIKVAESCRRHGKVAGIPCSPKMIPSYREIGYRFFNVTSDFRCVKDGLVQVQNALSKLGIGLTGAA